MGAMALLSGCFHGHAPNHGYAHRGHTSVVVQAPGPPPHAPAHGHRHRLAHHGLELVFDGALGVYAVAGWDDHFFHDGHFYRPYAGGWQLSARIDGGWIVAEHTRLPERLTKRAHRIHHKKQRAYPAKHDDWEREYDKDRQEHAREYDKDERERQREAGKAHREHEREYDKDREEHAREED